MMTLSILNCLGSMEDRETVEQKTEKRPRIHLEHQKKSVCLLIVRLIESYEVNNYVVF